MTLKCGFIGCGNMGGALAQAVRREHADATLLLCDRDAEKLEALLCRIDGRRSQAALLTEDCAYIFLGVKPQVMPTVLAEIAPALARRADKPVLVTMAAGITTKAVAELAGFDGPILRIMPNTPVQLGVGMVAAARNPSANADHMAVLKELLKGAGRVEEVDEQQMDAVCALSGSGPAFVYYFTQLLAQGGHACGLTQEQAQLYAAQTVLGAAEMMLQTGQSPQTLRQAVCSPGGTTLAGMTALEIPAFAQAVQQAVRRAYDRSVELGKQ